MSNLENILAITIAINRQKKAKKEVLLEIGKKTFEREKNISDLSARVNLKTMDKKDPLSKFDEELPEKKDDIFLNGAYESFFKSEREDKGFFNKLYHGFIYKMYEYKAAVEDKMKKIVYRFNGYTDKLLMEIEDWGVIYFKTVFENLKRLSPLGAFYRYLQTTWICVSKKVK